MSLVALGLLHESYAPAAAAARPRLRRHRPQAQPPRPSARLAGRATLGPSTYGPAPPSLSTFCGVPGADISRGCFAAVRAQPPAKGINYS